MSRSTIKLQTTLVGGGMITHDQLLPSLYHLQRKGVLGELWICALNSPPLCALAEDKVFPVAFPGQGFKAFPDLSEDPKKLFPDLFKDIVRQMTPRNLVVVAVPDHFHYPVIKQSLENNQNVLTVKPLVLKFKEAVEIEELARDKGLFVGIEYHKRFDRRSLEARASYRQGRLGEFKCGEAKLIEPWYYRHSNFQNWFTKENTDPFTYIGCHYVDLVYFITGLKPVEISLQGVEGVFPNGKSGFMWANGRVIFENGAILSVINGLGYPDEGAGSNDQGMCLYCEGKDRGGLIHHNDQFRGVAHSYVDGSAAHPFRFINPDYMRLVSWEGEGLKPVGYGYDSVEASVLSAARMQTETEGLPPDKALAKRQAILDEIDDKGIIATPKNSSINELVMEAGRASILNGGRSAVIEYGATPSVRLR
ncbi:MAG: Gfo/Idh/MocA family oxidoreductase [Verrucomicrobia bacterium]|nr:Gfo/Idh/MocA family oxidoreductase [Verrucomicrobiota bacterium]